MSDDETPNGESRRETNESRLRRRRPISVEVRITPTDLVGPEVKVLPRLAIEAGRRVRERGGRPLSEELRRAAVRLALQDARRTYLKTGRAPTSVRVEFPRGGRGE